MTDDSKLEKLKENYKTIKNKFSLPSFEELNREFQIEKISEMETDYLTREIRKAVGDKLANYMRFAETMLNPANANMFIFSMVKALGTEEKAKFTEIYKKLSKNELEFVELDTVFSEEKEAKFIKESHDLWNEIKHEFLEIIQKIKKNWDLKAEINSKGYFS